MFLIPRINLLNYLLNIINCFICFCLLFAYYMLIHVIFKLVTQICPCVVFYIDFPAHSLKVSNLKKKSLKIPCLQIIFKNIENNKNFHYSFIWTKTIFQQILKFEKMCYFILNYTKIYIYVHIYYNVDCANELKIFFVKSNKFISEICIILQNC